MAAFQSLQQSCLVNMNGIVNIPSTSSGERNYHQSNLLWYCSSRTACGLRSNDLDTQACCLLAGSLVEAATHNLEKTETGDIAAFKIYAVSFRDQQPFQINYLKRTLLFVTATRHTVHLWAILNTTRGSIPCKSRDYSLRCQFEIISEAALRIISDEYSSLFSGLKRLDCRASLSLPSSLEVKNALIFILHSIYAPS